MKKNIIKGAAIASLTIATTVAPIAVSVSCGKKDNPNELRLAMRIEDFQMWNPIIAKFKQETGINIKLLASSDQKGEYTLWSGSGTMPDICLADQNTVKYQASQDLGWFQEFDLTELGEAKYSIDGSATFNYKDATKYQQSAWTPVAKNAEIAYAMPYGVGAGGIWYNSQIGNGDSKDLFAYIPKQAGGDEFYKVNLGVKASYENIKKFIANSGTLSTEDVAYNGSTSTVVMTDATIASSFESQVLSADPNAKWYDNGPMAMYQRIASVAMSIGENGVGGWVKDAGLPYELVASLQNEVYDGQQIDDDKLMALLNPKVDTVSATTKSALLELFYSYIGYFRAGAANTKNVPGRAVSPKQMGQPGESEVMRNLDGAIMLGVKWQGGFIRDGWKAGATYTYDNAMKVISAPYCSIGEDSLALSADLSGQKLINAKKFIRYISTDATAALQAAGDKVVSPLLAARSQQENALNSLTTIPAGNAEKGETLENYKQRQLGFFGSSRGVGYGETGKQIQGAIATISSKGIYDIYNGNAKPIAEIDKTSYNGSYATFEAAYKETMKDVKKQLAMQEVQ